TGPEQEVLGRISGDRELGEDDEIGARRPRRGEFAEDLRLVALEVADDAVQLCERDPQGFRLTVTNPSLTSLPPVEIVLPRLYRGPLTSANGGYACGRLAAVVHADEVEVTLRLPPPLDRPLEVVREDERVLLLDGDEVVAEAQPAAVDV